MEAAGEFLRQRREANGLSQLDLAIRARTSQAAISVIERGEREPTVAMLRGLLAAMGEDLTLAAQPMPHRYEMRDLRSRQALSMGRRLEQAIAANERAHAFSGVAAAALRQARS
jgi:transcriptional regulator with XRE-family HTH domain